MLEYLGHFFLPAGPQNYDPSEVPESLAGRARFGYGGRAMCLDPSRDLLWISGHNVGDLVAAVAIPPLGETAKLAARFFPPSDRNLVAAAKLDELVGIAWHDSRLHALWQEYYDVDGQDGGRKSLWDGGTLQKLGDGKLKRTSGYLTEHERSLYCGRSTAAGSAAVNHGPALYKIEDRDLAVIPILTEDWDVWTEADNWTALAFIPGYVCWLVSKDTIPRRTEIIDGKEVLVHPWYGGPVSPGGLIDPWNSAKGYHTESREVWLVRRTWPGLNLAGSIILEGFHESSRCGGMAYDKATRRLYIHEQWPPARTSGAYPLEQPRIHVYKVPEEKPPPEKPNTINARLEIEGRIYQGTLEETP